jgi:uncharacterized protein (UPF0335 family)
MASYEDYLRELGHTADNVVDQFKKRKKDLLEKIERQKQENNKLSANIKSMWGL